MIDYRYLIEQTIENLDLPVSDFWLYEGVSEFAKQFPKMPEEKLRKLIALDPTYKGGEQVGKYGNWIIRLFYNNIKNRENNINYRLFLSQNPSGTNPKTGKPIQPPVDLPATPWEDADKIPNLLKQYEILKGKIKKPITEFKDLPSLYNEIQKYVQQDVPMDKKALERYNVFKQCEKIGLKKIFENKDWLIGIPETFESSKPFGQFTNWCTTSSYGRYYDAYLRDYGGEYYILLDKRTGELFQFHYESEQFMNESDSGIDMESFTEEEPEISKFLYEYKFKLNPIKEESGENEDLTNHNKIVEKYETTKKKFDECWENPKQFKSSIFGNIHGVEKIEINGDSLIGDMDIDNLGSIIYNNKARDDLSNESVCEILTYHTDWYDYSDYRLQDFDYYESDWNEIAKKYGIEKEYDWNKLVQIFKNDYDEDDNIPEEIVNIIQDDFFESGNLLGFLHDCKRYGTEQEAYDDVKGQMMEQLPMSGYDILEEPGGVKAQFRVNKYDLFQIFFMLENHIFNDVPNYNDKKMVKKLIQSKMNFIPPMPNRWWELWNRDIEEETTYYDGEDEDWLYLWRVVNGKCDMDDGTYGAFSVSQPYYGWDGFDEKYMKDGFEWAAKKIVTILGKELPKDEVK